MMVSVWWWWLDKWNEYSSCGEWVSLLRKCSSASHCSNDLHSSSTLSALWARSMVLCKRWWLGEDLAISRSSKWSSIQTDSTTISLDEVGIDGECESRVLDSAGRELVTGSFGYLSSLYKVIDSTDGVCYALRRVERVRTNNEMVVWVRRVCEIDGSDKSVEQVDSSKYHLSPWLLSEQWCCVLRSWLLSFSHVSIWSVPEGGVSECRWWIECSAWKWSCEWRCVMVYSCPAIVSDSGDSLVWSVLSCDWLSTCTRDNTESISDRKCGSDGCIRTKEQSAGVTE